MTMNFSELTDFIVRNHYAEKGDKVIIVYNKSTNEAESADTISIVELSTEFINH